MNDNQNNQKSAPPFPKLDEERQQRIERRKKKRFWLDVKCWILKGFIYFIGMVIASCLLEFAEYRFGFCLWNYLPIETAGKASGPAALITLLVRYIKSTPHSDKEVSVFRPDGMKFTTHGKQWLTHLGKKYILRNTPLLIGLLAAFTLVTPTYAAKEQWNSRVFHWFAIPHDKNADSTPAPPPPGAGAAPPDNTTSPKNDERPDGGSSEEDNDTGKTSSQLIDPKTLLLNTEDPESLTEEQYNELFFLDQIHDWDSEQDVKAAVHTFVQNKFAIQSSPNYSMVGISQSVQNSIATASDMEACATTSANLEEIINIRKNAYGKKEKGEEEKNTSYLLARLLRENFGVFGDAYRLQSASKEAAFTLYGNSVIWGFKTLNYDIPTKTYYDNLKIIEERYEKITMVVPANDCRFRYAGQLRDAFEEEAEQFLRNH